MNIQRVAKYITSFVGIALALAICVMPAFASEDGIYYPADYESGSPTRDPDTGLITYHYDFDTTPLIITSANDVTLERIKGYSAEIRPEVGTSKVGARVFPLGVYGYSNSNWPSERGVIDVRDFKTYSEFQLSVTFDVSWAYIMQPCTFEMRSFWVVYCYDSTGWYTGTIQSSVDVWRMEVETSTTTGHEYTAGGVIKLPENTSYIMPCCINTVYLSGSTVNSSYYTIHVSDLTLEFSIDSVLENALAMQVIKDQLADISGGIGDLNDTMQDVLSGTPEQNQAQQESADNVQNVVTDFNSIMADLEKYDHIEFDTGANYLSAFLQSNGYLYIEELISPIFTWTPYVTFLLTVLALVNLSLILFGR